MSGTQPTTHAASGMVVVARSLEDPARCAAWIYGACISVYIYVSDLSHVYFS